jgi:signal transduction histidine kinase
MIPHRLSIEVLPNSVVIFSVDGYNKLKKHEAPINNQMATENLKSLIQWINKLVLSVPVRIKVAGIALLPVLILGFTLNYWITSGLSDWLSYLLSNERVRIAMEAGSRSVTFVTILAAIASIFFSIVLTFLLTRPLLDLHDVALEVTSGNLNARAPVWANDEIGEVAFSVNAMIDRLAASQNQLAEANRRLEAINRVALSASRELDVSDVLNTILTGTLEATGLKAGWVYLLDSETNRFELAQHAGLPEDLITALATSPAAGPCTCQSSVTVDTTIPLVELQSSCSRLQNLEAPFENCTHVTIPLRARGQVYGIVNLLCEKGNRPSPASLELAGAIGGQASEILANAWLHERLVEKEAARRALLASLVSTQEDERARLAGELHDGAGQTLTSLLVRLKTLEKKAPPGEISTGLANMQKLVSDSIEQVRELSYRLRPASLETFGLARAIQNLVVDMAEEGGLTSQFHCEMDDSSLPHQVEITLYRIAQESLTNVIRHAHADEVDVFLVRTPFGIAMKIDDNGCGFDPSSHPADRDGKPHLGLISTQERAEIVGGTVAIFSAPGAGTSVRVTIPLDFLEVR